ncbi:MAG: tetratricopeptide repeat protein [Micropepsaceae bacterium]
MPFVLGVISYALNIGCIIHAIRNDRMFPWIYILMLLPGIGSLLYLFLEIIPRHVSARQSGALKRGVTKITNPNRDLKAAKREVELVGSVDAKRKLAEEYFLRGDYEGSIDLLRSALAGVHTDDPAILFALARALVATEDGAGAQAALDELQTANPKFVSADAHLLYVRALELQDKDQEALQEYKKLVRYFAGEEARCRYALLLQKSGETDRAQELFSEVVKLTIDGPSHYRRAQREWREIAKRKLAE